MKNRKLINVAPLLAAACGLAVCFRNETPDDLKGLFEDQRKAWESFKTENNKRLEQIEKDGKANSSTVQNVETLNKTIDELTNKITTAQEAAAKRADELEKKVNRASLGGGDATNEKDRTKSLAIFNAVTGKKITMEQFDAYNNAFEGYLRRGDQRMTPETHNAMSVGYEQGGGYFVSPAVIGPMQMKIYETSPMRQVAQVINISTANALEGLVDNDEASTGWTSEQGSRSETDTPEVGKYRIETHEQYAEPRITQQLLDDAAYDVQAWLGQKVAGKLGRTENTAFITGNGSGKPRGFLDYSIVSTSDATRAWNALQYVASGGAGDWAASNPADKLIDLVYSLKAGYRAGTSFLAARATVGGIRKFKDGNGQYIWQPGLQAGQPSSILNFPVVEAEDMPAIAANSYSLAFGNFKEGYIIVDRQGVRVLVDPYTTKPYVKFYTTKRVGGGLVNGEAIKVMKFAAS